MKLLCVGTLACLLSFPPPALAQGDNSRALARERFDRGVQLFNEGDNSGALAEFKRAYEILPNPAVLFNVGLVYAALNRPVESLDALDRLLANPGSLDADKLGRARHARQEQLRRVGQLAISSNVPAAIEIDGIAVGKTPLAKPLSLAVGTHVVALLAPGYLPVRKEIVLAGETHAEVRMDLIPTELKVAHLVVHTALPGVEIWVDGQLVGRTPLAASLTVMPGQRVIELRREGYVTARKELSLGDGASAEVSAELAPDPAITVSRTGHLVLAPSEDEVLLTLDGQPRGVYRASLRVPAGPHTLRIERGGFEPYERTVDVARDGQTTVKATLRPTPETRAAYVEGARARRRWAWTTLGVGVAVAAGAGVFAVINQDRLKDARSQVHTVDAMFVAGQRCDPRGGGPHDQCDAEVKRAYDQVARDEQKLTFGLVGASVGVAAMAIGAYLLATGQDPDKYDRPGEQFTWSPVGWVGPMAAGGVGLAGRF